jgi:hypothetical protein
MNTFLRATLTALACILVVSGTVSAQTDVLTTATATAPTPAEVAPESWYEIEKIEGDIDVGDFVVGPGKTELAMNPGDTIIQEITVTNRISELRTFKLTVDDITGSADGSSAVSLTDGARGPYSIRDYISFPEDTITLGLGERARIPVKITIPRDAEPGGLYGSVLVSTERIPEVGEVDTPRSPVIARIGSLFFVTVKGDVERGGMTTGIQTLDNKWWYEKGPINLGITFENTGSVHLNPYGELSITNMFGEQVGFVELEPSFVLPKSLRTRDVAWEREFLLGRYTVTAKINRGYDDVIDEVTTTFWVLPWKIVLGVFAVLFIIIFAVRTFFRTFEFSRKPKR